MVKSTGLQIIFFNIKYESIILCCSFVSFVYTGKTSPINIEDTCFDIDQASVNNMYLGNPKWSIYYLYIFNLEYITKEYEEIIFDA